MGDRARLWNAVEAREKRKDARLAKELEFALPRELPDAAWLQVAREMADVYTSAGHAVDLAIHEDGRRHNPHVHLMLTTRTIEPNGFGPKMREADSPRFVLMARAKWAEIANAALGKAGSAAVVDARSNRARGLGAEAGRHRGPDPDERKRGRAEAAQLREQPVISQEDGDRLQRLMRQGAFVDRFATVLQRPDFPFESREASLEAAQDAGETSALWAAVDAEQSEPRETVLETESAPLLQLEATLRGQLDRDEDAASLKKALTTLEALRQQLGEADELRRENQLLKARASALGWAAERDLPAQDPYGEIVRTGDVYDAQDRLVDELEREQDTSAVQVDDVSEREAAQATVERMNEAEIPAARMKPRDQAGLNWSRSYAHARSNNAPKPTPRRDEEEHERKR